MQNILFVSINRIIEVLFSHTTPLSFIKPFSQLTFIQKKLLRKSAYIFITFGCVLLLSLGYLILERIVPQQLAFAALPTPTKSTTSSIPPKLLIIPDLEIILPIETMSITQDKWESSKTGVSYLGSTPVPGQVGNSILYGHNWPNRLGKLLNIKSGQKITIVLADSTPKTFTVVRTDTVTPDQTHILSSSADARITLYTCTGFLDSKRFVVTAELSH